MLFKNQKSMTHFVFSAFFLMGFTSTAAADSISQSNPTQSITQIQFQAGTDSKGSYSFDEDTSANPGLTGKPKVQKKAQSGSIGSTKKSEGSKAKKKSEGSKGKSYSHGKKEGSKGSGYSHGKSHHGHKGHGYAHRKGEGSKGKKHGYGKHGGFHGKMDPFHHVFRFKHKLMLSEQQIAELKKHEFEYKKTKIQAKADKAIAHMELDRLVHSDTVDESAIRAVGQRLIAAKSRMINAKIEAKIAVLKILTPEQRKKVKKMHSRH